MLEAASGKRLGDFLQERVFKPLKMNDTAFHVPEAKANRLAGAFEKDPVNGSPFRLIDVSKQPANDPEVLALSRRLLTTCALPRCC